MFHSCRRIRSPLGRFVIQFHGRRIRKAVLIRLSLTAANSARPVHAVEALRLTIKSMLLARSFGIAELCKQMTTIAGCDT